MNRLREFVADARYVAQRDPVLAVRLAGKVGVRVMALVWDVLLLATVLRVWGVL